MGKIALRDILDVYVGDMIAISDNDELGDAAFEKARSQIIAAIEEILPDTRLLSDPKIIRLTTGLQERAVEEGYNQALSDVREKLKVL